MRSFLTCIKATGSEVLDGSEVRDRGRETLRAFSLPVFNLHHHLPHLSVTAAGPKLRSTLQRRRRRRRNERWKDEVSKHLVKTCSIRLRDTQVKPTS